MLQLVKYLKHKKLSIENVGKGNTEMRQEFLLLYENDDNETNVVTVVEIFPYLK